MIETVVTGLILAAVSALTWVAYNHAKAFEALNRVLIVVGCAALAIYTAWTIAVITTRHEIVIALIESGNDEASTIAEGIRATAYEDHLVALYVFVASLIYLTILNSWVTKLKTPSAPDDGDA